MISNCGICKGEKEVTLRKKKKTICFKCSGTGLSAEAKDVDGKDIIPGALARILPRPFMGYPDDHEIQQPGFKGSVRAVYNVKDRVVIDIVALPELSGNKNTTNHGVRSTLPKYVKLIDGTAHSKRVKEYEEKVSLKKEKESDLPL